MKTPSEIDYNHNFHLYPSPPTFLLFIIMCPHGNSSRILFYLNLNIKEIYENYIVIIVIIKS